MLGDRLAGRDHGHAHEPGGGAHRRGAEQYPDLGAAAPVGRDVATCDRLIRGGHLASSFGQVSVLRSGGKAADQDVSVGSRAAASIFFLITFNWMGEL